MERIKLFFDPTDEKVNNWIAEMELKHLDKESNQLFVILDVKMSSFSQGVTPRCDVMIRYEILPETTIS